MARYGTSDWWGVNNDLEEEMSASSTDLWSVKYYKKLPQISQAKNPRNLRELKNFHTILLSIPAVCITFKFSNTFFNSPAS